MNLKVFLHDDSDGSLIGRRNGGRIRLQGPAHFPLPVEGPESVFSPGFHFLPPAGQFGSRNTNIYFSVGYIYFHRVPVLYQCYMPPEAASGETCPMESPEVPPEKRPSVTKAHALSNRTLFR